LIRGGVANLTWLEGKPYPLAGLTLLVLAAEERGARLERLLEVVDDVDEFEERYPSGSTTSRRLRSLLDVGSIDSSMSIPVGSEEKGSRPRIGVRIARMTRAMADIARKHP